MRIRLLFLILALSSICALRAETWEQFELQTDAPMVARSVNITDSNGTWNAGNFLLTQGQSGSASECLLTATGSSFASTMIMIFTPLPALVQPIPSPPPLALEKVSST